MFIDESYQLGSLLYTHNQSSPKWLARNTNLKFYIVGQVKNMTIYYIYTCKNFGKWLKRIKEKTVHVFYISTGTLNSTEMEQYVTRYDLKRLELYSQNMVDYHLIMDLVPTLARLHFLHLITVHLSAVQAVSSTITDIIHCFTSSVSKKQSKWISCQLPYQYCFYRSFVFF